MTTAMSAGAERRHGIARRLAEGHRVGDVMDEYRAQRHEVMDAGFAFQLRFVDSRDAFDVTARTHRTVLPAGGRAPTPVRHHPLIRPVVAPEDTVPEPTGGQEAAARRTAAVEALRDRIAALDVEPRALRTWAHLRGIDCPRTGMLPGRVVEAYEQWVASGRPAPAMPEPPGPPPRPELESTTWEELGDATVETITEDADGLDLTDDEVDELLDEPAVDDNEPEPEGAPAVARVVALAEGCPVALAAAVLAAAAEHAPGCVVATSDGWLYLEQAAS